MKAKEILFKLSPVVFIVSLFLSIFQLFRLHPWASFLIINIGFAISLLLLIISKDIKTKELYAKDKDGNEYKVVAKIKLSKEQMKWLESMCEENKHESDNN